MTRATSYVNSRPDPIYDPRVSNHLAIDIGAESGRAMLGRLDGDTLRLEEVCRFPNQPVHEGATLRWAMDRIHEHVADSLRACSADRLTSVGVDTWGCDYGLVNDRGDLLERPYHYRDHRTDGVMARVLEQIGLERVYATTGIQCLPFNTLFQLVAAREQTPEVLHGAHRLLTIPDLVNHRLTGRMTCEFTNATTTQCVDARTGSWARDLLRDLDLPPTLFGDIVQPGSILGVLAAPTRELGETTVVAPACHDTGSAFAAVEAGGDVALLSCGTWSLLGTEMAAPTITDRTRALNFTNEGGVNGSFRLLKNIGGLWLLQACRRAWADQGQHVSYDELVHAAATEPAFRTVIDADDPSFLNPVDMPAAIAAYCDRTRQPRPDGPGAHTRAILESLALKYRIVLDALQEVSGRAFRTVRIVGGGSRNALLAQFTADATGRNVLGGPVEATALGNLAVQMVGVGAVSSLSHARAIVNRSFPPARYEPRSSPAWNAALDRLRTYMA
jgi:rhamnulokinase